MFKKFTEMKKMFANACHCVKSTVGKATAGALRERVPFAVGRT